VKSGVVVFGIVGNHHHAPGRSGGGSPKVFQKPPASDGVEFARLTPEEQFAVAQAHGAEIADTPSRGMVEQHRVLGFG